MFGLAKSHINTSNLKNDSLAVFNTYLFELQASYKLKKLHPHFDHSDSSFLGRLYNICNYQEFPSKVHSISCKPLHKLIRPLLPPR